MLHKQFSAYRTVSVENRLLFCRNQFVRVYWSEQLTVMFLAESEKCRCLIDASFFEDGLPLVTPCGNAWRDLVYVTIFSQRAQALISLNRVCFDGVVALDSVIKVETAFLFGQRLFFLASSTKSVGEFRFREATEFVV